MNEIFFTNEASAVLAAVVTGLAALALLRGFFGERWSQRVAAVAWLLVPGVLLGTGPKLIPAEFGWVRAVLLLGLAFTVWDRALGFPVPAKRALRGLLRLRRISGWLLAPVSAMVLVRVIPLNPLDSELRSWLVPLLIEDGRFALVATWLIALFRAKERPPFILWASSWTALHVAALASMPEARHFLDLSPTFLGMGMIYALGAWGLQRLLPKFSWLIWLLILAHDLRSWLG